MKFFILDDEIDLYRSGIKEALKGKHELTIALNLEGAKILYQGGYDVMLLDHDMRGVYDDPEHPTTATWFVRWLVATQPVRPSVEIILHSHNSVGRLKMREVLEEGGYQNVSEFRFCTQYVEYLKDRFGQQA